MATRTEGSLLHEIGETFPDVQLQERRAGRFVLGNVDRLIFIIQSLIILLFVISSVRRDWRSSAPVDSSSSNAAKWSKSLTSSSNITAAPPPTVSPPLALPLAVVDIHTSSASFTRVSQFHQRFFQNDRFIANGTFVFRVVVAEAAQVPTDVWPISRVKCGDEHEALPCRVDQSYPAFLNDFPTCDWLFRGEDDTWLNTTVLYHYILMLNSIYRPREHIVFRAHANPERLKNWFLHGGCGWLASRAYLVAHGRLELSMVKLLRWARYHQQDTAESIIVRHMFAHPVLWDEMGLEGFLCENCGLQEIHTGKWDQLPECPAGKVGIPLRDLFAVHTASLDDGMIKMLALAGSAPSNVLMIRQNLPQRSTVCKAHLKSIIWDAERRPRTFLVLEDLPNPLIDYDSLPDDNSEAIPDPPIRPGFGG
jgi:hypothetical protein